MFAKFKLIVSILLMVSIIASCSTLSSSQSIKADRTSAEIEESEDRKQALIIAGLAVLAVAVVAVAASSSSNKNMGFSSSGASASSSSSSSGHLVCADLTREQADQYYATGDHDYLDRDNDGTPCESIK